jgi:hypothetical protein
MRMKKERKKKPNQYQTGGNYTIHTTKEVGPTMTNHKTPKKVNFCRYKPMQKVT